MSSTGRLISRRPKIRRSAETMIGRAADDGSLVAAYGRLTVKRQGGTRMKSLWDRWGPLTGPVSVACSFVGVMLVLNQPQDKDSDAKIAAYFARHSHQVQGVVGFFVFLVGILFLLTFLAALRERLLAAEGQPGLCALVFGAGVASLPLWAVSMLLANAASFASSETSTFRI